MMLFRARISKDTVITFDINDLLQEQPKFSIRHLVIPWLLAGNTPDRGLGVFDADGVEIFENDVVQATRYPGKGRVIYNEDEEAGACFLPQFDDDETIDWWQDKERWYELKIIGMEVV